MMKTKKLVGSIFFTVAFIGLHAQNKPIYQKGWIDFNKNGQMDIYEDPSQDIENRIDNLIAQMTDEEKVAQTATLYGYGRVLEDEQPTAEWKQKFWVNGIANIDEMLNSLAYNKKAQSAYSYPFSRHAEAINTIQRWFIEETRLGIPVDFSNEGIHGLCHDRATPLPAPIGMGSTWNKSLLHAAGEMIGREAKALGYTNIYTPILDVSRDPRWGRIVETFGENPFLIAELGKQEVLGIQGQGVASTLKHYAVYSVPKGGRDGNSRTDPHVAPREMHQLYLYPFKRVIEEARPMGVMSSYNDYDGIPITGSHYFLTELLRGTYGFHGYVVSDSEALEFLYTKHHVAASYQDAIKQALEAGMDVRTNFGPLEKYTDSALALVKAHRLDKQTLDQRVANVLRVKFKLGLFDHPYVSDLKKADQVVHTNADQALSDQINRESLVLLKNEQQTLPLDASKLKRVLITGPLAEVTNYTTSRYGPSRNPVTSIREGIGEYLSAKGVSVDYAEGCKLVDKNWPESEIMPVELDAEEQRQIQEAVKKTKQADVIIAAVGEDANLVGESLSRTSLNLPGHQLQLLQALYATGKPVVLVLVNGRPLSINWENRYLPAILETWFPGPQSGKIIAEALFGDYNPGGKLPVTFPKSVGQVEFNFPFKPASQAEQPRTGPNGGGKSMIDGVLYPFGYGLSYTQFELSDLKLNKNSIYPTEDIEVSVQVRNVGKKAGDEVVQLYLKDMISSVIAYDYDLRGFERVTLQPGETKRVSFSLKPRDMVILDRHMNWTVEPGDFKVMVGNSSQHLPLEAMFTVKSEE